MNACNWKSVLPTQVLLDESGKVPAPLQSPLVAFCFVLMSSMPGCCKGLECQLCHSKTNRRSLICFWRPNSETNIPILITSRSHGFDTRHISIPHDVDSSRCLSSAGEKRNGPPCAPLAEAPCGVEVVDR